jgi:hypothetical protein
MKNVLSLQISSPAQEGVMRASKWLKHPVLLDEKEMKQLFSELPAFEVFCVSEPVTAETLQIPKEDFLIAYAEYIQALKQGMPPDERKMRRFFSSVFTTTRDILYAMEVGKERYLVKTLKPVVQLQAHNFFVSSVDGKFHSMVLGKESVTWGIQFSYPQIFQDPKTFGYLKVDQSSQFPNSNLFHELAKWLRKNTMPTPFIFEGKKSYVPIRIGKNCLSWIHHHPGLKAQKLEVKHDSNS